MPLLPGNHPSVISANIRELRNAGHTEPQAIAIAMHTAKQSAAPPKPKHKRAAPVPKSPEEPGLPEKRQPALTAPAMKPPAYG